MVDNPILSSEAFPIGATTRLRTLQAKLNSDESPGDTIEERALEALASAAGTVRPSSRSIELYLILGIDQGRAGTNAVIYPPEFLYIYDAGHESLVGLSIAWRPSGLGDPDFPDFSRAVARSVLSRSSNHLIYPNSPGQLIMTHDGSLDVQEMLDRLTAYGLTNVSTFGSFIAAECKKFYEVGTCAELMKTFSFLRSAEPDHLMRINDFAPGWTVRRLA